MYFDSFLFLFHSSLLFSKTKGGKSLILALKGENEDESFMLAVFLAPSICIDLSQLFKNKETETELLFAGL